MRQNPHVRICGGGQGQQRPWSTRPIERPAPTHVLEVVADDDSRRRSPEKQVSAS